ncbi:MAG: hypothetical protein ABH886_03275 [Candidatus Desantisbacteria bacterium]
MKAKHLTITMALMAVFFSGCETSTVQQWHPDSSLSLSKKAPSDILIGGKIGYTRVSDYPSQPIATQGSRSVDGRILQHYVVGNITECPAANMESDSTGAIQKLTLNSVGQLLFFDTSGAMMETPCTPGITVLVTTKEDKGKIEDALLNPFEIQVVRS